LSYFFSSKILPRRLPAGLKHYIHCYIIDELLIRESGVIKNAAFAIDAETPFILGATKIFSSDREPPSDKMSLQKDLPPQHLRHFYVASLLIYHGKEGYLLHLKA
jgi:hypothetical protein